METLTIEHLAPYLSYELQVSVRTRHDQQERIGRMCEITHRSNHGDWVKVFFDDVYEFINTNTFEGSASNSHHFFIKQDVIKPILRPLEDLKGYMDEYDQVFYPNAKMLKAPSHQVALRIEIMSDINTRSHAELNWLLYNRFDVFGLIEKKPCYFHTRYKVKER